MPQHSFDGTRKARAQRKTRFSQASTRRPITLYDQTTVPRGHKLAGTGASRRWSASIELKSGMPTGLISNDFKAPLTPDQKYLVVNEDNVSELYIDYRAWYRDRRSANQSYHKKVVRYCTRNKLPEPKPGDYSMEMVGACGEPPRPIETVVAAYQGNPWILGLCHGCGMASNACSCPRGYRPYPADPRLAKYFEKRDELEQGGREMDFGPESYVRVVGDETPDEMAQRPVQFRTAESLDHATDLDDLTAATPRAGREAPSTRAAVLAQEEDTFAAARQALEDDEDPAALGGRRIPVTAQDRAKKQAPRRPSATAVRRAHGAHESAKGVKRSSKDTRRSLADGAVPGVADGPDNF